MKKNVRCLLVDDEPLARHRFRSLLEKSAAAFEEDIAFDIVGEAESGTQAIPLIYTLKPDVLFLDIQMPGLNGFDILDFLVEPRPHIVFITAYDEYALRAFEVHALDYLTKPVRAERLEKTLQRLCSVQHTSTQSDAINALRTERDSLPLTRLTVHSGNSLRVVSLAEIRRIEAEDKQVQVFLADGCFRTDFTLDVLETRLDKQQFLRVHRSHLVRIDAVREIIPWFSGSYCLKLDDGTQLPVARRRVSQVKALFGKG